jgi:hypothetical protein
MQTIIMMAEIGGNCFFQPKNDYSAEWKLYIPTGGAIDIEDLPLSWELNNQLTEWVEFYEENFNVFIEGFPVEIINNFDILGKQLWQLVKEELASEYKVVYYSELEKKVLDD